ncbi:MAG: peroxidase-related enzyme [Alphaproteobacteria bacterium]|nr:peroxidase-related enzyme [Alphaproteobacteria bacterium]
MDQDAAKATSLSWLRFDAPPPASAETDAILAATRASLGYARHQQEVLAYRPRILAALTALGDAVVRDPAGALSAREREVMALVVSAENRCEACVFAHAAALRKLTGQAEWAAAIAVNYRRAELTARERALADYAVKATRGPAEVEPTDLDALRASGISEAGVLEAATVVAYFNFTNRLNSALGIRANSAAYWSHR